MSEGRKGVPQLFYVNIHIKKVGGGGLKDLTSAISRGHPHTYNFGYFRHRRKTALDKLSQIKYTSNNRRKIYDNDTQLDKL